MAYSGADLLHLQGNIKRDPQGYADEFTLQWRHYQASLSLFLLHPSQGSTNFAELTTFISHTAYCYPEQTSSFATDIGGLLDKHGAVLDGSLRQTLVKALILLRNKQQLPPTELLPLLFRLFRIQDKALRSLVFRHIVSDIKAANKKSRNDRLNRTIQNFMYSVLAEEHEPTAKRGLAVLIEMWRRHVWRDARTVNVIASATFHTSPRIMLAALKFFLGQDAYENEVDDDDDDDDPNLTKVAAPSKEDRYKAFKTGTVSSKKKKQKKLKRVMQAVKKQDRKEAGGQQESFAALQLLNDPQGFAEKLFARMQAGKERFETRLAMMQVLSRAIGVHKLIILNFYPYLQKYMLPSQRDVTQILANLVQACHELVPPDTMEPVLRQLVDQFVHDRARPEVATIGLKVVREICTRCPLVMTPELLQDLVEYRKDRNKAVKSAARGLAALFRELAPEMLRKKDRGRGADMSARPMQYGDVKISDRVEGADLLQAALLRGDDGSDSDDPYGLDQIGKESDSEEEELELGSDAELENGDGEEDEESSEEEDSELDFGSDDDDDDDEEEEEEVSQLEEGDDDVEDEEGSESEEEEEEEEKVIAVGGKRKKPTNTANPESISSLKKKLAAVKAAKYPPTDNTLDDPSIPMEWGRMLTQEDFERIRELKHKKLVQAAMAKHGLKSASKRARALEAAEAEAEEMLELKEKLGVLHDEKVDPMSLVGKHKYRKDKAERMASVLEGREGREFGAKSSLKKQKTGGLSNKEKLKKKFLPQAAHQTQVTRRKAKQKAKSGKNFKGHVRQR